MKSNAHRVARTGVALVAFTVITACGSAAAASSGGVNAATAQSATAFGGMDGLIAAAKKEGELNVIALPPDWANYGAIIKAFADKYGIKVNSAQPDAASQDEINAANQQKGKSTAPDVFDLGQSVALANTAMFAPYKVATFDDISGELKDPNGTWVNDYGGYMSIGYDSSKVPPITERQRPAQARVQGQGRAQRRPDAGRRRVLRRADGRVANGGSADDIAPGVDFFESSRRRATSCRSTRRPPPSSPARRPSSSTGTTSMRRRPRSPHLEGRRAVQCARRRLLLPGDQQGRPPSRRSPALAGVPLQRQGQNLFLKGRARPVEMAALTSAGSLNTTYAAALPPVDGTPVFLSPSQSTAAAAYLNANWAQAIGS